MPRGRVLLLEDDLALRGLLEEAFTLEELEVTIRDSFEGLRAAAEAGAGDIIIADFWGSAQQVLDETARTQMRELAQLAPVVLLTGRSWATTTTPGELWVKAIIRKPFDLNHLLETVRRILQSPPSASSVPTTSSS
jgi:DNA-binding NtrC family response regulator